MTKKLDVVQYMKMREFTPPEGPPETTYTTEADAAAIANLERLQRERPLKPPGRKP